MDEVKSYWTSSLSSLSHSSYGWTKERRCKTSWTEKKDIIDRLTRRLQKQQDSFTFENKRKRWRKRRFKTRRRLNESGLQSLSSFVLTVSVQDTHMWAAWRADSQFRSRDFKQSHKKHILNLLLWWTPNTNPRSSHKIKIHRNNLLSFTHSVHSKPQGMHNHHQTWAGDQRDNSLYNFSSKRWTREEERDQERDGINRHRETAQKIMMISRHIKIQLMKERPEEREWKSEWDDEVGYSHSLVWRDKWGRGRRKKKWVFKLPRKDNDTETHRDLPWGGLSEWKML